METPIRFTWEALLKVSDKQRAAILRLAENGATVEVMQDFSLPEGYVAFRQKFNSETMSIYGGIDSEGTVST